MTEIVDPEQHRDWNWWYLLLLIPFVAVLWVPFYNSSEPYLDFGRQRPPANYPRLTTYTVQNETGPLKVGLPLFYWYQLLWVLIGAALAALVYFMTERR